MTTESR